MRLRHRDVQFLSLQIEKRSLPIAQCEGEQSSCSLPQPLVCGEISQLDLAGSEVGRSRDDQLSVSAAATDVGVLPILSEARKNITVISAHSADTVN